MIDNEVRIGRENLLGKEINESLIRSWKYYLPLLLQDMINDRDTSPGWGRIAWQFIGLIEKGDVVVVKDEGYLKEFNREGKEDSTMCARAIPDIDNGVLVLFVINSDTNKLVSKDRDKERDRSRKAVRRVVSMARDIENDSDKILLGRKVATDELLARLKLEPIGVGGTINDLKKLQNKLQ